MGGLFDKINRIVDTGTESEKINSMDSRAHSRSYHRFFEGYTEVREEKSNGRGHILRRYYTGTYYIRRGGRREVVAAKVFVCIAVLLSAVLYILSSVADNEVNSVWYATAFEAAAVPFLVWALYSACSYAMAPAKMTAHQYRSSSVAVIRSTLFGALTLAAAGFVSLGYIVCHGLLDGWHILWACEYLTGALCLLVANRFEAKQVYEKQASELSGKINGNEIR